MWILLSGGAVGEGAFAALSCHPSPVDCLDFKEPLSSHIQFSAHGPVLFFSVEYAGKNYSLQERIQKKTSEVHATSEDPAKHGMSQTETESRMKDSRV